MEKEMEKNMETLTMADQELQGGENYITLPRLV